MRKLLLGLTAFLLFTGSLLAQRTITGRLTDENGNPVPNASIVVRGTTTGTTSKPDGTFSLTAPESATDLVITSVGFESATVAIQGRSLINLSLKAASNELSSVVVTGFSRVKKSEFAGAATKIDGSKINFVPNASFDQILQGKAPGVLITAGSGQPGSAARVQIRGASSITGGNAPLYVVDGMPVENGVFQSMNPNDFESVDVLRDAVSTAPYGNRGSNGVIVVTTKKGKSGKFTLSYAGQYGITQPGQQKFDMMNSAEILSFHELLGKQVNNNLPGWAFSRNNPANAGLPAATLTQYDRNLDSLRAINTDWRDVFQRSGSFHSHDVNLSGGTQAARYFLSAGIYDEDGIGLRSDLKRYTVRANIDSKSDKVTLNFNTSAGYTKRNFIESENGVALANPFAAAYLGLPYHKLFNPNGTVATGSGRVGPNAYDRVFTTTSFNDQVKVLMSSSINYDITKNFYIGGFAGLDYRQTITERSVFPNTYASNTAGFPVGPPTGSTVGGGSYNNGITMFQQYIARAIGGFRKVFADKHDVDIQLISEYTREKNKGFAYTGFGINTKLLNTPVGITPGTVGNALIPTVGGNKTGRTLYGATALVRYSYDGKYTFNGSFRRDASSQLPEENRWQNFYAAGLTWNVMKETFTDNWRFLSELRVRASYGTAANADGFPFGNFGYLSSYGGGSYAGNITIVPTNAGNDALTWEKIATTNLGIDFGVFKNRITGSVDVYEKKSTDGIVTQTLPAESGFGTQDVNAATVRNRGVEVQASIDVIRTKDITWTIGGNFAYNANKVVSLGQVQEFPQGTSIIRVGLPLGSHFAVKWGGVDAATGQPLYYTKDGKLTNVFSDANAVAEFGTFNAPRIGGFSSTLSAKGVTIYAQFAFQNGFSRFNNQDFFQLNHAFATQGFNLRKEMLTMWSAPGQITNIQSPLYQRQFSSKDIQNASYLRLRTITMSYDLPASLIDRLRVLGSMRIFVQGQNLATWTNWVGFDPEDNNNIAAYEYPTPRTYTVGINVSFK